MAETESRRPALSIRLLRAGWGFIEAGILLFGLAVTSFLIARLTVGERWDTVAYANNFIPWWALGGLIAALIALGSRRRGLLIALQLPGMCAFVLLYGAQLLPADRNPAPPTAFTAMTYNIIGGTSDPQRVAEVITAQNADIVGIQELGPAQSDLFATQLTDQYPYQALYPGLPVHGVGLLSRHPIVEHEVFGPFPDSMRFIRATIDLNGVLVTVYVAHPRPPQNILTPITYDDERRDAEITALVNNYLRPETGPMLVLGDFNMTDQSDSYALLSGDLNDAFRVAGRGLGFTFPDKIKSALRLMPLLIRIDYVWYTDDFRAYDAEVVPDSGTSDHRPVITTLNLQQELANR